MQRDGEEYENYLREIEFFANQKESKLAEAAELAIAGMRHADLLGGSNTLGGYQNYEQDIIREAYSSTSYSSLRDLPNNFRPGEVALARQLKVLEMQKVTEIPEDALRARRAANRNNGLFHQFEYIPSRYTLQKELEAQERMTSKAKALELGGGHDFIYSSAARRAKYEDGFGDKEYRYPYQSDPYDSVEMARSQERVQEKAKILHGPFVPSGRSGHSINMLNSTHLPEIKRSIQSILEKDWGDCVFQVEVTDDEMIAVRFSLMELDGQLLGLRSYMNMLEGTNKSIQRFALTRLGSEWNIQPGDGWIYFIFRPPWVKASLLSKGVKK